MPQQQSPDWDAYCILQRHYLKNFSTFYLEATDNAMERCLIGTARKATGRQLAKDLFRDGKRAARWVNKMTGLNPDLHFSDADTSINSSENLQPTEEYVQALSLLLKGLTAREKQILTLSLKGVTYQDPLLSKQIKITARTYRHTLTTIRKKIKANATLKRALFLAINFWGYTSDDLIALMNHQ